MSPLIAIAASVLPDILKAVIGRRAGEVADTVAKAVTDAAGTSEPARAREKIEADPQIEKELRIRLAEIAAEEEQKEREAALAEQKLALEEAEQQHKANIDLLKTQFDEDAKRRDDEFRRLQASLADTQAARSAFSELARARNPFAWGPVVVSVVVALGFFVILGILLGLWDTAIPENSNVTQIINIAIGALTAGFATVVSFWLGSSQGSRNKDFAAAELQAQTTRENARIIERQVEQTQEILREQAGKGPAAPEKPKASNARRCIDIILQKEGGFVDHPDDPGGATNMGITIATLGAWRDTKVTKKDVETLTEEEARAIYETNYWKPLNCDALPAGVDLVVFDFGVNAGPARSARLLQRVCGANPDGVIGPITVGAVESLEPERVIPRFSELRLDYYRSLPTWETFGRGWTNRTGDVQRSAIAMLG